MKCTRYVGKESTYARLSKANRRHLKKYAKKLSCFTRRRRQCLKFMSTIKQKDAILCDVLWTYFIHKLWYIEKKRWQ